MTLNQVLVSAIVVLVLGAIAANVYMLEQPVPAANGCRAASYGVLT